MIILNQCLSDLIPALLTIFKGFPLLSRWRKKSFMLTSGHCMGLPLPDQGCHFYPCLPNSQHFLSCGICLPYNMSNLCKMALCAICLMKSNLSDCSWNIPFSREPPWLLCLFPINFGFAICFLIRYLMSSCMFAIFDRKPGKILCYIMETRGISNCVAYTLAGSLCIPF